MKKNPSSSPNSHKKSNNKQSSNPIEITEFNSTDTQSDQIKNDESVIPNYQVQSCITMQFTQDNQINKDNQLDLNNKQDDLKNNAVQKFIISSASEIINQSNHQQNNNIINMKSQIQYDALQIQNQQLYQNLHQENSNQLKLIKITSQDENLQLNKDQTALNNQQELTIEENNDKLESAKFQIENKQQQQFENIKKYSQFQLNNKLEKNNDSEQQQTIENLDINQKQQLNQLDKQIPIKQNNIIEENRQDIKVNNYNQLEENTHLYEQITYLNQNKQIYQNEQRCQEQEQQPIDSQEITTEEINYQQVHNDNNKIKSCIENGQCQELFEQQSELYTQESNQYTNDKQNYVMHYSDQTNIESLKILEEPHKLVNILEDINNQPVEFSQDIQKFRNQTDDNLQYFEQTTQGTNNQIENQTDFLKFDDIKSESEKKETIIYQEILVINQVQFQQEQALNNEQRNLFQDNIENQQNNQDNLIQYQDDVQKKGVSIDEQKISESDKEEKEIKQIQLNIPEEENDKLRCNGLQKDDILKGEINQSKLNIESELLCQHKSMSIEDNQNADQQAAIWKKVINSNNLLDETNLQRQDKDKITQQNISNLQQNVRLRSDNSQSINEQLVQLTNQKQSFEEMQEIILNNQETVDQQFQQKITKSQNHIEEHQAPILLSEENRYRKKQNIEVWNIKDLDQNILMKNLNFKDEEIQKIQSQPDKMFQSQQNNNTPRKNQKIDQNSKKLNENQIDSNFFTKIQQSQEQLDQYIQNQYEINQQSSQMLLNNYFESQDFQQQQNSYKSKQKGERNYQDGRYIDLYTYQKKSQQRENFFISQTKLQSQNKLMKNQFYNSEQRNPQEHSYKKDNHHYHHHHIDLGQDEQMKAHADEQQKQKQERIRELELQIQEAQKEINEKDEEIKMKQDTITNFENFILQDYNPEEFEKIILSESNFETDNVLITDLIKKLRQFLQEIQNSIIELINSYDVNTDLEKDQDDQKDSDKKGCNKHINVITREFKKYSLKQQKKDIEDYQSQTIFQDTQNEELEIANHQLDQIITNVIGQTKILRDILQKNCCQIIKFNCDMYNGLQGMSKNKNQLQSIRLLTKTVKEKTECFQSIINNQVNLQLNQADNDQKMLLQLLKQLINKQEEVLRFQQQFSQSLFERIDLVFQSEDNLREDMSIKLQTFY